MNERRDSEIDMIDVIQSKSFLIYPPYLVPCAAVRRLHAPVAYPERRDSEIGMVGLISFRPIILPIFHCTWSRARAALRRLLCGKTHIGLAAFDTVLLIFHLLR